MTHHVPTAAGRTQTEPAAFAEAVRVVLVALVALGWVTLPDTAVASIVSAVGVVASLALTYWTRGKATSLAAPRAKDGVPLVRADRPPKHVARPGD